ncbi:hypothetical protein HC766_00060 [Candidatus Gracilibacteria bacterium]|nr:hypothetical protein [Candidatus Gracilibacteria bacterium]
MISGTNGKTTTRSILTKIYQEESKKVLTNIGGANIMRGIATSLLLDLNWIAKPTSNIAILEVEEATLPKITKYIKPNKIIFTNIFRDQLDAYGEIDQTLEYFHQTLDQTNSDIIINKDDAKLLSILEGRGLVPITFGVGAKNLPKYEQSKQMTVQSKIHYKTTNITNKNFQSSFNILINNKKLLGVNNFNLTGVFNLYNVVAAIAASNSKPSTIQKALKSVQPVFGRGEIIKLKNSKHRLFLVKNPAGFEQVIQMIQENSYQKK